MLYGIFSFQEYLILTLRSRMPHPLSPGAARGNDPGLIRQLGFFSATALVISNMIGMGIFTTTGYMAGDLGSAGLILACWSVGALFTVAGTLSYSELGINFPSSGGEYVYLTHAFGPEWGFMTGWVSFFAGFSAPIAAAAVAFSDYLGYFFPNLKQEPESMRIGVAGVGAGAPLDRQALLEEGRDVRGEKDHGRPPVKKLWHESAIFRIRSGGASKYQYVWATLLWPRYVDNANMCFVIRSRLSGQVSRALTANVCLKEWIVGRGSPGPRGRPIFSAMS